MILHKIFVGKVYRELRNFDWNIGCSLKGHYVFYILCLKHITPYKLPPWVATGLVLNPVHSLITDFLVWATAKCNSDTTARCNHNNLVATAYDAHILHREQLWTKRWKKSKVFVYVWNNAHLLHATFRYDFVPSYQTYLGAYCKKHVPENVRIFHTYSKCEKTISKYLHKSFI